MQECMGEDIPQSNRLNKYNFIFANSNYDFEKLMNAILLKHYKRYNAHRLWTFEKNNDHKAASIYI